MADSSKTLAAVLYYARERYYRHVQTSVLEVLKKYGSDPVLLFWKAYGIIMEDRLAEGMRELETILDKRDMVLCAPMLLIYAHKRCKTIDREAVQQLEARVRSARSTCGEKALYNAGMFLWLSGRHDKAREYVDRMLKVAPGDKEGLTLRGWIDLTCSRETFVKKSIKFFDEALAGPDQPKLAESLFGKARFYVQRYNFTHALEVLNQVVAGYPGFLPGLVEKMKVQLALQDWEQAVETAQRCLSHDINCLEATRVLILELLAMEGNYEEAAIRISDLIQLLDRFEPKNHALYHDMALAFARLAGGHNLVLQQTMTLVERAMSLSPLNSDYVTELGYEHLLRGEVREALQTYKKAFNLDETSIPALAGIIHCQLLEGQVAEAEQQLEFLAEVQSSLGKQSDLLFLNALLAQKKGMPSLEVISMLQEAVEVHFIAVKGNPLGARYFHLINPEFLLQAARAMMVYAPTEPASSPSQVDHVLRKAAAVLDPLTKCAPGMIQTLYLLARIKFLSGQVESAQASLQQCISHDSNSVEAHLLMARLSLHQGHVKQCSSSLELALSRNFEVQGYPLYHLVKAQTDKQAGAKEDALASLQTAMSFITSKKPVPRQSSALLPALSLSEKATVYLELANMHTLLGQQHEATKVMQDAINEFKGTSEEVRISIANADLALAHGDTDHALTLLQGITEDKPYFIQAKKKMAEIFLSHRKDRKLYVACYQELAEKLPGSPTALLLGDAYMNVQEPEAALEVYEGALKRNPRDGVLASKIGQALIKTHNYTKAINYYEAALKSENQQFLRSDLAELYLKLRQFDRAERTLTAGLSHGDEALDLDTMMEDTKYLLLLAKVYQKANKPEQSLQALNNARDMQSRVLKRVGIEQPEGTQTQKQLAASISCQIAEHNTTTKDYDGGIRFYRDALHHDEHHSKARLSLAELHLLKGELEACEHECVTLLRTDPGNEEATVMMADLLFRKGEYNQASQHFQELLGKKPDHFQALARLIELNRRSGQLEACEPFLDQAEKVCARSAYEPGMNYCKGLFKRYQNMPTEALSFFNHARKDSEWGEKALFNMIMICLNPDNETLGGETLKPLETESGSSSESQMAVRTAEKLLKEVRPKSQSSEVRVRVLENLTLLATKSKQNAEEALKRLMGMASTERDSVPVLLGMATAHMILRQTPRARNHLKRIAKMQWNPQDADEMEQSWLLLADIYIQSGKYDMSIELLKKCIQFNQSCSKAWEYRGFISEKEQAYKDAASHYEKAWKYSSCSIPSIGYKLAFNYLKARRYVDTIDVCHKVLQNNPSYPKIRKDILEKARQLLRS